MGFANGNWGHEFVISSYALVVPEGRFKDFPKERMSLGLLSEKLHRGPIHFPLSCPFHDNLLIPPLSEELYCFHASVEIMD